MKISLNWLAQWINTIPQNLSHQLTMAGLEVDAISEAAPQFSGVVIGEVKHLEAHPNADKLRVAMVDIGDKQPLQIVCGAPNVAVNIKVPVATIGAVLPGNFKIKASKLRGVESSGMLCSARELGISDDHAGLMILPNELENGSDFRSALALDDTIIEVDLTPNRGDCLSILGIAREVSAINGLAWQPKIFPEQTVKIKHPLDVTVDAPKACPRYLVRAIKNINPNAVTPLWMQEALRRADIRTHSLLVDITNYVLLELGQPMHAFNLDAIQEQIIVRMANENETLTLLNDEKITLTKDMLVIADKQGVIALAGIMGGASTACTESTQNILLESAWFNPVNIAGKARNFGLQTDASHRFERGVDFNLPRQAMERATQLLVELADALPGEIIAIENEALLPKRDPITVTLNKINRVIGLQLSKEEVTNILQRIDPHLETAKGNEIEFTLLPPSHRFDLSIEEDLIEEVARLYGYDNIPIKTGQPTLNMGKASESVTELQRFKERLVDRDYMEAITMSFVHPEILASLTPECQPIALKNPISPDLSVMRTTLLAGLLKALDYNLKRQQKRLRLFESGLIFEGNDLSSLKQIPCLAGVICGDLYRPEWGNKNRKVDFFDVKGDVESLLMLSDPSGNFKYSPSTHPALHPGQSADIHDKNGNFLGFLGTLHPNVANKLDLNADAFVFELRLPEITQSYKPKFNEISKFPYSKRDLALLVPKNINYETIINNIKQSNSTLLKQVELFDIYQDLSKSPDQKSMTFSLYFQNIEENLKDSEIDIIIETVLSDLKILNITLRQ